MNKLTKQQIKENNIILENYRKGFVLIEKAIKKVGKDNKSKKL